ncbi:hypothetical protein B7486_71790 [cyanobacterium TDX16]|nr:hypothetical protein B7486_71790 [cyanobacterium TDX16]
MASTPERADSRPTPERAVAELSSVATALEDLVGRVASTAEGLSAAGVDDAANDLFEVERSLQAAARRLSQTLRDLP